MLSRREFLQAMGAAALLASAGGRPQPAFARTGLTETDLLRFAPLGQVTLLHMADCHAQLKPIFFREPSINLGVGADKGAPQHLTGTEFLQRFGLKPGSLEAYALTSDDFERLAVEYGRVGGMDRMARLIAAIRAERGGDRVLLLDGGDTLQGSYTALVSRGADMVRVLDALGVDATTGHWEFTLGEKRISELYGGRAARGSANTAFLAANVVEQDFEEPVFRDWHMFERGGTRIAVIGQAFPYTPIANPRWLIPRWSFGIREDRLRKCVAAARAGGAELVVLNSHNGFDVDRKLARRVEGIDVIFTAHSHDALPAPTVVERTLLVASGSHTKFLSRLDIEISHGRMTDYRYALIPVLADAIEPDPAMATLIEEIRGPHAAMLGTELARSDTLLYRRGNFAGSLDDLICEALLAERDGEICFSPGFRWGATVLAGQPITWEDVYNATAISYPATYRIRLSGAAIKAILEDVADNLFNPDPYYRQGGDMVRTGGLTFTINVDAGIGRRISDMRLASTDAPMEAERDYVVTGWASVNEGTAGPPIWDVLASHLKATKVVEAKGRQSVRIVRGP